MKHLSHRQEKEELRRQYQSSKNRFKVKKEKSPEAKAANRARQKAINFKMVQVRGVGVRTRMERRPA